MEDERRVADDAGDAGVKIRAGADDTAGGGGGDGSARVPGEAAGALAEQGNREGAANEGRGRREGEERRREEREEAGGGRG